MASGSFIVFEGPDGSGTTRQSGFFAERLRKTGKTVVLTAEPTESTIGQEIRTILHSDQMPSAEAIQLLFCADRADHVANIIKPALESGKTVVTDRYALSTIIYGAAQGVDKTWLEEVNAKFPKPDLTFITLPPFDVCLQRLNRRPSKDQFELESFQRRIYDHYKSVEDNRTVFIDTSRSKRESADAIWEHYQEVESGTMNPAGRQAGVES